ncbi:uncharacterized protein LOC130753720 [Actinidia eriantha]|uniref:uncharacterized protein LOC130753720 n=1 Tax=Actinidia eriantha TaxID=165200 RepID=UPI00258CFD91|nr:uncharacterized protein LOC130753720 [Actinidia eriantha]
MEEDGSESYTEGESLGGFIVNGLDVYDGGDVSASEDVSDDNVNFDEVLSTIQRSRGFTVKWEFEVDMLAAFGKDLELCMKASVSYRGTTLAEFLTDGDPQGEMKKSVKEQQEHDPKGPELCRTLATHYSKQLYAI